MSYIPMVFAGLLAISGTASAGTHAATTTPAPVTIGSRNVATADPALPRPGTQPCVVPLLTKQRFGKTGNDARMDATPHTFRYAPPAHCPGPWAKVVLEVHFAVAAGHQYDRTASIWLNGVNLYFGTTEEPSPGVARSWTIERDLSDYSSLLRAPGNGQIRINNWLGKVFSSPIRASARLLFYPADAAYPAPRVPDHIYAMNGKGSMPAKLDKDSNRLAKSLVFPRNTTRVYLDLFAEPQAHDEFYYVCLPEATIRRVGRPRSNGSLDRPRTCGGGSFREVEITIDDTPAGLAPVTPWVFTGGLDPFLWQPTPGPEALDFVPYRVNLSPFAGLLDDGKPHTVAIRMLGTPHFFSIAAALLVYQDRHATQLSGAVTRNTLATALPTPIVTDNLKADADGVHGGIFTRASMRYVIEGYVDTSHGRIHTRVETAIDFDNSQHFGHAPKHHRRHFSWQSARVDSTSTATAHGVPTRNLHKHIDYTLEARTLSHPGHGTIRHRGVEIRQRFARRIVQQQAGLSPFLSSMSNTHVGAGELTFERGVRTSYSSRHQSSVQNFRYSNSLGDCYQAEVQARNRKVTAYTHGQGCLVPGMLHWFVHPDDSPDSFGWRH